MTFQGKIFKAKNVFKANNTSKQIFQSKDISRQKKTRVESTNEICRYFNLKIFLGNKQRLNPLMKI